MTVRESVSRVAMGHSEESQMLTVMVFPEAGGSLSGE